MTSQVLAGCCCRCCDRDSPGVHMKPMGVLSMTLALLVAAQTKVISEQMQAAAGAAAGRIYNIRNYNSGLSHVP